VIRVLLFPNIILITGFSLCWRPCWCSPSAWQSCFHFWRADISGSPCPFFIIRVQVLLCFDALDFTSQRQGHVVDVNRVRVFDDLPDIRTSSHFVGQKGIFLVFLLSLMSSMETVSSRLLVCIVVVVEDLRHILCHISRQLWRDSKRRQ